jgi:folate-binding protein YgfZ
MSHTSNNNSNTCFTPLQEWSCISVIGADAVDFLQNQLTNSVKSITNTPAASIAPPHQQNRFAGYCSAKGRLMASFWIMRQDTPVNNESNESQPAFYLFISKDLAASLAKRLSMFVLRSKVKVLDLTESIDMFGFATESNISGEALAKLSGMSGILTAELPVVSINQVQTKRYLFAVPKNQSATAIEVIGTMGQIDGAASEAWNWLEIQSAIPRITQATFEQFVPQMINMESLKGIDFQKGCYPGQEVVARSQYRGTIKRRLHVAHLNHQADHQAEILPGNEIFHSEDPTQPCGMVVLAAPHPLVKDRVDVQVECKLEALQSGSVHLGSATGPALSFSALPYPLIEI